MCLPSLCTEEEIEDGLNEAFDGWLESIAPQINSTYSFSIDGYSYVEKKEVFYVGDIFAM